MSSRRSLGLPYDSFGGSLTGRQLQQSRHGGPETAASQVEVGQVSFEVDVQPLTASRFGVFRSATDQGTADSTVLPTGLDHSVE